MWYKLIATFENGKTASYELKGMTEVMKMVARLKNTSEVVYCKNRLVGYKIIKGDN